MVMNTKTPQAEVIALVLISSRNPRSLLNQPDKTTNCWVCREPFSFHLTFSIESLPSHE